MRISSAILAVSLLFSLPASAQEVKKPLWSGRSGLFVSLDGGTSVVNTLKFAGDELTGDILAKGGYRFGRWGFFALVGYNSWVSLESDEATSPSATNIGLGADVLFFEGRARTSLALGPSIYNTDASGEAGEVGFFIDLRPVGFRFPIADSWSIGFDPIAFNFNAPVLSKIPLLVFKYVSIVSLEYTGMDLPEPPEVPPPDDGIGIFLQASFHFSLLSDDPERSVLADTLGFGLRVGYRLDQDWAIFLHLDNNRWFTSELETMSLAPGAINFGLGGEYLFFEGRARTSVVLGSSTLLMDTFLLEAGAVGIFFEVRPLGIRWSVADDWFIVFDPLTFAIVAPEPLTNENLVMKEYRTLVGVEVAL
jgi:hypothetical protein